MMKITEEWIQKCAEAGAGEEALQWLKDRVRTFDELKKHNIRWALWMMNNTDCPIDLERLKAWQRASVMIHRVDCPINLRGLGSRSKANVMLHRKDCPVSFEGLDSWDRMRVRTRREEGCKGR